MTDWASVEMHKMYNYPLERWFSTTSKLSQSGLAVALEITRGDGSRLITAEVNNNTCDEGKKKTIKSVRNEFCSFMQPGPLSLRIAVLLTLSSLLTVEKSLD